MDRSSRSAVSYSFAWLLTKDTESDALSGSLVSRETTHAVSIRAKSGM
jgi:hypothetical protein